MPQRQHAARRPDATTPRRPGLVYPVWAMIAMAVSVTTIFVNSIGGRPALLFQAIGSVGRHLEPMAGMG